MKKKFEKYILGQVQSAKDDNWRSAAIFYHICRDEFNFGFDNTKKFDKEMKLFNDKYIDYVIRRVKDKKSKILFYTLQWDVRPEDYIREIQEVE